MSSVGNSHSNNERDIMSLDVIEEHNQSLEPVVPQSIPASSDSSVPQEGTPWFGAQVLLNLPKAMPFVPALQPLGYAGHLLANNSSQYTDQIRAAAVWDSADQNPSVQEVENVSSDFTHAAEEEVSSDAAPVGERRAAQRAAQNPQHNYLAGDVLYFGSGPGVQGPMQEGFADGAQQTFSSFTNQARAAATAVGVDVDVAGERLENFVATTPLLRSAAEAFGFDFSEATQTPAQRSDASSADADLQENSQANISNPQVPDAPVNTAAAPVDVPENNASAEPPSDDNPEPAISEDNSPYVAQLQNRAVQNSDSQELTPQITETELSSSSLDTRAVSSHSQKPQIHQGTADTTHDQLKSSPLPGDQGNIVQAEDIPAIKVQARGQEQNNLAHSNQTQNSPFSSTASASTQDADDKVVPQTAVMSPATHKIPNNKKQAVATQEPGLIAQTKAGEAAAISAAPKQQLSGVRDASSDSSDIRAAAVAADEELHTVSGTNNGSDHNSQNPYQDPMARFLAFKGLETVPVQVSIPDIADLIAASVDQIAADLAKKVDVVI